MSIDVRTETNDISALETVLDIALPPAYAAFLERRVTLHVDGHPLLGLPLTGGPDSVLGATALLWTVRPAVERSMLVLQFRSSGVLCIDVQHPSGRVVLLDLHGESQRELHPSFAQFLQLATDERVSLPAAPPAAEVDPTQISATDASINSLALELGLELPESLRNFFRQPPRDVLRHLAYRVDGDPDAPPSVRWALQKMGSGVHSLDKDLVPVLPVDDRSFACVVAQRPDRSPDGDVGCVVRWHLGEVPLRAQRQLLDTSLDAYLHSTCAELTARDAGLRRMRQISAEYDRIHHQGDRLPKAFEERPIRLAVQNVIVGLAAVYHDSAFDGLSVSAWQTCEAPHVGAHEGARGLLAITLAEAFRAGGTMEIRFDRHPEQTIPASLTRYARTRGLYPGTDDPRAISPADARALFVAVSQMPTALASRISHLTDSGQLSPERACFVLQSGIWRPVELDFILATSCRARSILRGGADPFERPARQAELGVCRSALMLGMLYARLSRGSVEGGRATRVLEDERADVRWSIIETEGAVRLDGLPLGPIPWNRSGAQVVTGRAKAATRDGVKTGQRGAVMMVMSGGGVGQVGE